MLSSEINIRDPFVLVHGGKYYLYGTRGATCWGKADGFDVYVSDDMQNWDGPIVCFSASPDFWADQNFWAPEVHAWNGTFYMFASFKCDARRRGTAILRAESPLGPFVPWSDGPVTPAEWECLDGTFYVDRAGKPWMVFCHEWVQAGDGTICALPLDDELKRAAGECHVLFSASEAKWCKSINHSSGMTGYVTDGPFMWRAADGKLLLLWASFSEGGYTEGLAVSDNGDIDGKFTQLSPLFERDGGHGMVFKDCAGKLWLTLHSPNEHLQERPHFYALEEKDGILARA